MKKERKKCLFCGKTFTAAKLEEHLQCIEIDCSNCFKYFLQKCAYKNHLNTCERLYDDESIEIPECDICGAIFKTPMELNSHKENCFEIEYDIKNESEIKNIENQSKIGNFKCKTCDKSFKSEKLFAKHVTCKYCEKCYGTMASLKKHIKNVHNVDE